MAARHTLSLPGNACLSTDLLLHHYTTCHISYNYFLHGIKKLFAQRTFRIIRAELTFELALPTCSSKFLAFLALGLARCRA